MCFDPEIVAVCPLVDLRTPDPKNTTPPGEYLLAKSPTSPDYLLLKENFNKEIANTMKEMTEKPDPQKANSEIPTTEPEDVNRHLVGIFGPLHTFDKGWSGQTEDRNMLKATPFEIVAIHGILNGPHVLDTSVENKGTQVNQENNIPPETNHAQKSPVELNKDKPEVPSNAKKIPIEATKKKSEDPNNALLGQDPSATDLGPGVAHTGSKPKPDLEEPAVRKDVQQPPAESQPQKSGNMETHKMAHQADNTSVLEETRLFMLTDDGALRTAKICKSKLERMDLISAGVNSEWCNLGESLKSLWNPKRLKLFPEIGMLSFQETPSRILLIDIFRRYQYLKDVSVLMHYSKPEDNAPKLDISSCTLKSDHLALRIELTQTLDEYWSDVFVNRTVQQTRGDHTKPSIGLLTNSGLLYRFKLESEIQCGDPCDIYKGLKSGRKPFAKFAVHRTQTIDSRLFVIGMLILLTQV